MPKHTRSATIMDAGGGGAFVEIPFDMEKELPERMTK